MTKSLDEGTKRQAKDNATKSATTKTAKREIGMSVVTALTKESATFMPFHKHPNGRPSKASRLSSISLCFKVGRDKAGSNEEELNSSSTRSHRCHRFGAESSLVV